MEKFLKTRETHEEFRDLFERKVKETKVTFSNSEIGIDWTYAMMHLVAQRILVEVIPEKGRDSLLDVGSVFSFISFAATFCDVTYLEPRVSKTQIYLPGICSISGFCGEAQNLPFENDKFGIVTSLHAIEHFGLGRYGDTLDYFGDQKGLVEFSRVLRKGGNLISGVPAAVSSRLDFNEQRVYSPEDFDRMLEIAGFEKIQGFIVYPPGHHPEGVVVGDKNSLESFPATNTPPVYLCISKKI